MKTTSDIMNVISKNSEFYHQAYDFTKDWLKELKKSGKRKMKTTAYQRTLRSWSQLWDSTQLADIAQRAQRIMNYIKTQYPMLKNYK